MIIYGQENYVERINKYFSFSNIKEKKIFSFSLLSDNPAEYKFDYSIYDTYMSKFPKDTPIIVAFDNKFQNVAVNHIKEQGFSDVIVYDAFVDNKLKKDFFKKIFLQKNKDFYIINEPKSVVVYMAKSVVDKPIKNFPANLSKYIVPIQVGATLTDKRIADVTDDTGDNISERNRRYSEITALYWMWKNADADYLGLCHYRRLWKDLDIIVDKLQNGIIDIVLPLPTLCIHSVIEDYMKKYIPDVYPIMLSVLQEMSPEYFEVSKEIFNGQLFYACNMLIAKQNVLHDLCQWMFPIVMEVERRVGDLPDSYYNRYAGFCTERLITLYFLYNKQNWRIAHAEKVFLT